jgi:hypothetical protein
MTASSSFTGRFSRAAVPGTGRVRRNPAGISAPAQCHQSFALRNVDYWITAIGRHASSVRIAPSLEQTERERPLAVIRYPQLRSGLQSFAQRAIRDASQPTFRTSMWTVSFRLQMLDKCSKLWLNLRALRITKIEARARRIELV